MERLFKRKIIAVYFLFPISTSELTSLYPFIPRPPPVFKRIYARRITMEITATTQITLKTTIKIFWVEIFSSMSQKRKRIIIDINLSDDIYLQSQSPPSFLHPFVMHTISQVPSLIYSSRQYKEQLLSLSKGAPFHPSKVLPFTEKKRKSLTKKLKESILFTIAFNDLDIVNEHQLFLGPQGFTLAVWVSWPSEIEYQRVLLPVRITRHVDVHWVIEGSRFSVKSLVDVLIAHAKDVVPVDVYVQRRPIDKRSEGI